MSDRVTLVKHTAVKDRIEAEKGIIQELADQFTFYVPNYQFNPKYKAKVWDGKIRLTSVYKPVLYSGLRTKVKEFCDSRGYEFVDDATFEVPPFDDKVLWDFIESLNLPKEMNGEEFKVRSEQLEAIKAALNEQRLTILSPTGSGKSLILYIIYRAFALKTLMIVPTINLVNQMAADLEEYNYDVEKNVHKIYGGQDKNVDKLLTISTWQSLQDASKEWLSQFEVVLCDEVHGAKAKELTGILERMEDCEIRIGCTGSLDDSQTNQLVIQGLFGRILRVATTAELQEQGKLSALNINCIVLGHRTDERALHKKSDYQTEIDYIVTHPRRNEFIKNLALSLSGNTLILFQFVEKHGHVLRDLIDREAKIPVLYVAGDVDKDDREAIRQFIRQQESSITIASSGVFSTGINIPNLNNLIFASPSKARIKILQSIGRVLRKTVSKIKANLYDIADDLTHGKRMNYTLKHFIERVKLYNEEGFFYKTYQVEL